MEFPVTIFLQTFCNPSKKLHSFQSVSNVPIVTARNAKRLNGNPRIRHVSPAPLEIGKWPNRVQDAHLEAIHVAHLVVHIHPCPVLEPIVQSCTRWFREGNQKGPLFGPVAFLSVNLVHFVQVIVRVRVVEPVPKQARKDNLDGRKAHSFVLGQHAHISQNDALGINAQHP